MRCGAQSPENKRFCGDCGATLGPTPARDALERQPAAAVDSQAKLSVGRRQLTVVFCDLVGSTDLSTRLDPEDLRDVLAAYRHCIAATVQRFDGYIARHQGDGALIYFGYPQATEDDAEQAIRAGLAIVEAVGQIEAAGGRLQARVGIASGLVVVGDLLTTGDASEREVVGETPNFAARLQALAPPGRVVVADSTRRLATNLFDYRDLGAAPIKGFAQPVRSFEVVDERQVESRFEAAGSERTPLIGRNEELALLVECWQRAASGTGRVVLISGEPGIGKSRLAAALRQHAVDRDRAACVRYGCSLHHTASAFYPIVRQLERAAGLQRGSSASSRNERLRTALAPDTEAADFDAIAELVSPQSAEHRTSLDASAKQKKDHMLAALVRQVQQHCRHGATLVVWEDAHWIDPSSQELLELLVHDARRLPVLVLVTFRPEYVNHWSGQSHVGLLQLARLNRSEDERIIQRVARGKLLPREVTEQIIARADGVPLFVEELTASVLESGLLREEPDKFVLAGPLPPLAVPTSLQAALTARLDRLAPVRDIVQAGAAIGREFTYELLAGVTGQPRNTLSDGLAQFVHAGLLQVRGHGADAIYAFKHALLQDAAYESLLRSQRRQLHARIGQVLQEQYPELAEHRPEMLAQHFEAADQIERSVTCWLRAGERALLGSANVEAVTHLKRGLGLIYRLPRTEQRNRLELGLLLALGSALRATSGHSAPETAEVFSRVRQLRGDCSTVAERMIELNGLWGVHLIRAELDAALRIADEARGLAEHCDDASAQILSCRLTGATLTLMGEFTKGRHWLERALAISPEQAKITDLRYSQDHRVSALVFLTIAHFALGYPEQAARAAEQAVQRATQLGHGFTTALALLGMVNLQCIGRDFGQALHTAGQTAAHAETIGSKQFHNWAQFYCGLARFWHADRMSALQLMQASQAAAEELCAYLWKPLNRGLLADAYIASGQLAKATELLDQTIALAKQTGERWFDAELHRLRGVALHRAGRLSEAEETFERAMAIAQRQAARMWELRAAVDLARLLSSQHRCTDAARALADVYGRFTEGLGSVQLLEAARLLEALDP